MPQKFSLDFSTTQDEAVELTIHHLRLAAMFFQNIPDGTRAEEKILLIEELQRQIGKPFPGLANFDYRACESFINTIVDVYAEDKE
jgi:hypothetical protein